MLLAISLVLLPAAVTAAGPATTRVSVDSFGRQSSPSQQVRMFPVISADGRFVAFQSDAPNLVPDDTNGTYDVFVHDRRTRATQRVSVSSAGAQAVGGESGNAAISADGRFVAFWSGAANLVAADTNNAQDVFIRDRQSNTTVRASVTSSGAQTSGGCGPPSIGGDGRFVAFTCFGNDLVSGDTNGAPDVFVRDTREGTTVRASLGQGGAEGNARSEAPSISEDGRLVAFQSDATNLVPGDGNGATDVFVRDLQGRTTTRASVSSSGGETNTGARSLAAALSADGRYVAFESDADNLVAGDINWERDIFVRNLGNGQTARVSVESSGREFSVPFTTATPAISADGRFVAFERRHELNGAPVQIYVKDTQTGALIVSSVDQDGQSREDQKATRSTPGPAISGTGRFVAFQWGEDSLAPGDTNGAPDVFLRDTGINAPPRAAFTASAGSGSGALELTVDAGGAVDRDGWIESYAWTFGEGGTATGEKGTYAYKAPGTYTVTLTVTDNDGAPATASRVVTLAAQQLPPPPAPPPSPPPSKVCTVTGTRGTDLLRGTPRADRICGLGGNDRIDGRGGNDVVDGGAGNDQITGGPGRDTLMGGPGQDRLSARDGAADTVDGGPGRDTATVDRGRDRVRNMEVKR